MVTDTLVSTRMIKETDKAFISMDQSQNGLATNTLVSTKMAKDMDKALILGLMAKKTLGSSKMAF